MESETAVSTRAASCCWFLRCGLLRTRLTSAVVSSRTTFTLPRGTDGGGRSIKMALSGERREIGLRRTGFWWNGPSVVPFPART
jgi:hypothetical protein